MSLKDDKYYGASPYYIIQIYYLQENIHIFLLLNYYKTSEKRKPEINEF